MQLLFSLSLSEAAMLCVALCRGPRDKELMYPATSQQGPKVRSYRMQYQMQCVTLDWILIRAHQL